MKARATKNQHGNEGFLKKGHTYDVSDNFYREAYTLRKRKGLQPLVVPLKEEKASYETKEEKTRYKTKEEARYTYEKNGVWYTVYSNGKQVDKFKGKDGLKDYGFDI